MSIAFLLSVLRTFPEEKVQESICVLSKYILDYLYS